MPVHPRPAPSPWPLVAGLILAMTLWHLGAAVLLPVTQDEAYYFDWARSLSWGYFDHPPGVAAVGLGTRLAGLAVLQALLDEDLALADADLRRLRRAAGGAPFSAAAVAAVR